MASTSTEEELGIRKSLEEGKKTKIQEYLRRRVWQLERGSSDTNETEAQEEHRGDRGHSSRPPWRSHDLSKGKDDWGPYSKTYAGISCVRVETGLRFDLSVFPGYYRRRVDPPNVNWESGYHPWRVDPELGAFVSYRFDLEWKDQVYCDVSYSRFPESNSSGLGRTSGSGQLVRCELVNRTDKPQSLVLHFMASMNFPPLRTNSPEQLRPSRVILPSSKALWVHALDYNDLHFNRTPSEGSSSIPQRNDCQGRVTDRLVYDGFFRGEVRGHDFVDGAALGQDFGARRRDSVSYRTILRDSLPDAVLLFRYRLNRSVGANNATPSKLEFAIEGFGDFKQVVDFGSDQTTGILNRVVPLNRDLNPSEYGLKLTSIGGSLSEDGLTSITLLGFVMCSRNDAQNTRFESQEWHPNPQMSSTRSNDLLLQFEDEKERQYGLAWDFDLFEVREILNSELDRFLRYTAHNHVDRVLKGDRLGHFTNVFLRPITLPPHSHRVVHGFVCEASALEHVRDLLEVYHSKSFAEREQVYNNALSRTAVFGNDIPSSLDSKFGLSQTLMASTLLTNIVFPVYTRRQYIRHHTPGKWWDSLYTWDSGFLGLGLLELDFHRAFDCLATYLVEPEDIGAAFIHHGSMVPVQAYLSLELWNRTQSSELLAWCYPRLRYYYRFLTGRDGSGSSTSSAPSDLLKTWDYFYNSGGWDDYPAQVEVHRAKLEDRVTPVVTTAHAIRFAKILSMAAAQLQLQLETDNTFNVSIEELQRDIKDYQNDIDRFSSALAIRSWDEDSGYFSYVLHHDLSKREEGNTEYFKHSPSGKNFNMGLDGASPLVSGICTPEQETRLVEALRTTGRLWSPIGLCAVDQSAPYYRPDGYWNGTVWFPHQWFFWKSLLDLGLDLDAERIAMTALEVFRAETDETYNCFEHFVIETGRGAGWHHFGGLSAPVLSWYHSYFVPGTFTAGFNVWVLESSFSEDFQSFKAKLLIDPPMSKRETFAVIVCLRRPLSTPAGPRYAVSWDGETVTRLGEPFPGTVVLHLPYPTTRHESSLTIQLHV